MSPPVADVVFWGVHDDVEPLGWPPRYVRPSPADWFWLGFVAVAYGIAAALMWAAVRMGWSSWPEPPDTWSDDHLWRVE